MLEVAALPKGPAGDRLRRQMVRLLEQDPPRAVKGAATAAGLNAGELAGHSLRAGLATSAARAGASERAIMKKTGHKSLTIVRKYIREGEAFTDDAAAGLL